MPFEKRHLKQRMICPLLFSFIFSVLEKCLKKVLKTRLPFQGTIIKGQTNTNNNKFNNLKHK